MMFLLDGQPLSLLSSKFTACLVLTACFLPQTCAMSSVGCCNRADQSSWRTTALHGPPTAGRWWQRAQEILLQGARRKLHYRLNWSGHNQHLDRQQQQAQADSLQDARVSVLTGCT